jgi:hypothetical protein
MENERLLTQDEFEEAETKGKWENDCTPIMEAQDAKTAAAIIKWLDEPCEKHLVYEPFDNQYHYRDKGTFYWSHKKDCFDCWQELKESVKHE